MHNLLILIQVLFIYIKILIIILFITVIMFQLIYRNIVILGFNAIRSNSIYGNLNHVTPENYAIKIWKRIK